MTARPQEIIGKWYNNLLGIPDHYQLILDAERPKINPAGKASKKVFITVKHLYLKRRGLTLHEGDNFEIQFLDRPQYGEMFLEQLNKRLMKAIFNYLKR